MKLLDLSVGMGNLLLTVLLNLQLAKRPVEGTGVDIGRNLVGDRSNWRMDQSALHLFHQDGLQELLIEPMDLAISDLPVGYYPQDDKARSFITAAPEGQLRPSFVDGTSDELCQSWRLRFVLTTSNFLETEQSEFLKNG